LEKLVIIPTYNEKENIEAILQAIYNLQQDFHMLVIDDGSPDGTAGIVRSLQPQFNNTVFLEERQGKQGLGTAYIYGFKWAMEKGYQFIFEMDADFSHSPFDLPRLYDACKNGGADVAVGSRYVRGGGVKNWPWDRIALSKGASIYTRLILWMLVTDPTAGFVCYRKEVLETINLDEIHFVGYAFQIEMKFLAWKFGFKLSEVPIIFTDRTRGESKMSPGIFKEAFFGVLQMTIQSWFKKYIRFISTNTDLIIYLTSVIIFISLRNILLIEHSTLSILIYR